mgnify:CR=1 FL=1
MRKKRIIEGVSKKQSKLLSEYINFVQGIAYEATEDCSIGKFEEFNSLIENILKLLAKSLEQIGKWMNGRI